MPPLNRQDTRPSIHSYWSDSNPGLQGPTINLHAAAKPLLRFLYNRQALGIIEKNRGNPLSSEDMDIYLSYFPWNYVSWSTKAEILWHLTYRAGSSEEDARTMIVSGVFHFIEQMLRSPDSHLRSCSWRLLARLASYEYAALAILDLKPCAQLVSLSLNEDYEVMGVAMHALAQIARRLEGAQAIIDSEILGRVLRLLELPFVGIGACELVGRLAGHNSTSSAILKLKPCARLLYIVGDEDYQVVKTAMHALAQIAQWSDGAEAIVDTRPLGHALELLKSPRPEIRQWTCTLVARLASHESTAPAILELKLCERLVSLMRDKNSGVIFTAVYALSQIARWLEGAQDIVVARALDNLSTLLNSPCKDVWAVTCSLVGWLASHESTAQAILALHLSARLVFLIVHEPDVRICASAIFAVCEICGWPDGVAALVSTDGLPELEEELNHDESLDVHTRSRAHIILDSLARYKAGKTPLVHEATEATGA
ncbi:hypothetical protein MVEN_02423000 [Mycena venus]|uniref:ARM repeat-containing protein n=1 Tax=Mycena venus TaxID=2733690 RepID=A0A8H7CC84_9AGAR|nr:hypothetical protein MVEN_02423000 [Mycena venus]